MIHSTGKSLHLIVIHIAKVFKNFITIENGKHGQRSSETSQMLQAVCSFLRSHNSMSSTSKQCLLQALRNFLSCASLLN